MRWFWCGAGTLAAVGVSCQDPLILRCRRMVVSHPEQYGERRKEADYCRRDARQQIRPARERTVRIQMQRGVLLLGLAQEAPQRRSDEAADAPTEGDH